MLEILLGLLGGGGAVQLLNMFINRSASRRQMNAESLGKEVEALERTIVVLESTFEKEVNRLRGEIDRLEKEVAALRGEAARR